MRWSPEKLSSTRLIATTRPGPWDSERLGGGGVFTNGHVLDGDEIILYYGASDTVTRGARGRISEILNSLL